MGKNNFNARDELIHILCCEVIHYHSYPFSILDVINCTGKKRIYMYNNDNSSRRDFFTLIQGIG